MVPPLHSPCVCSLSETMVSASILANGLCCLQLTSIHEMGWFVLTVISTVVGNTCTADMQRPAFCSGRSHTRPWHCVQNTPELA